MPKLYDEPCTTAGIVPKQHSVSRLVSGRIQRYPFAGMLVGDFLLLSTEADAKKVRNALKTFYGTLAALGAALLYDLTSKACGSVGGRYEQAHERTL